MPDAKNRSPYFSAVHDCWVFPLTQGVIALVDGKMVPSLSKHAWFAYRNRRRWYARGNTPTNDEGRRSTILMHRMITHAADGMEVDHRRHRPFSERIVDNRIENLRVCTHSQNQMNKGPQHGGTSIFKGIHWSSCDGKWISRIRFDGRLIQLGSFSDEAEAAKAYDVAAEKYFGDFARTNESLGFLS